MIRPNFRRAIRVLSLGLLAMGLASGCDELNSDEDPSQTKPTETKSTTKAPATTTNNTPASTTTTGDEEGTKAKFLVASVTGNWFYKNEIMKLKQSGSSIQGTTEVIGFKNNPADPVQTPVPTVGSMAADGTVKVDELLIYTKNPSKNFRIKKIGGLTAANTLTLEVTAGQKAHTQTWVRR